ncbi:MAG: hypothetical protein GY943_26090 [Chloroflexi bacterium]|nr:hypothetical protein [Chloroflexota bacterium]
MTASSLPELRPLDIGQLFDRSFRLYRKNFSVFLVIIAIVQIPVVVINIGIAAASQQFVAPGFDPFSTSPADLNSLTSMFGVAFFLTILASIVSFIASTIGMATVTKAASDSYLGQEISITGALQKSSKSWLPLLGALFLVGLIAIAAAIPLGIIFIIPCLGWVIGFVGFIALGLMSNATVSLMVPIVVLEKKSPVDAIKRAYNLTRLRFWWIIGYLTLLSLLLMAVLIGPTLVITMLVALSPVAADPLITTIFQSTLQFMLSIIFLPLQYTAITLMYFDLRIRFEGFDLMLLTIDDDADDFKLPKDVL